MPLTEEMLDNLLLNSIVVRAQLAFHHPSKYGVCIDVLCRPPGLQGERVMYESVVPRLEHPRSLALRTQRLRRPELTYRTLPRTVADLNWPKTWLENERNLFLTKQLGDQPWYERATPNDPRFMVELARVQMLIAEGINHSRGPQTSLVRAHNFLGHLISNQCRAWTGVLD